jgi:amino acid transporter
VAVVLGVAKRLLVGRPVQSDRLGHTLLPKRIALPVFASDALSSVAYATEQILVVLSVGGIAYFSSYTPWIALAVGVLMLVVVASYRQNVHAYPSGGGDYEVASTNLGQRVGLAVASALMVDYTLTVAVSVSAGVANLASAFPALNSRVTLIAVLVVAVIALMNLRGVRESGTVFAIPTYCFIGVVVLLILWGLTRMGLGHHLHAESAAYRIPSAHQYTGLLLVFLLLRAFSSGCTALTGVEAISNGVPAFRKPKSKNAATTLAMLGLIAVAMFAGVTALALVSHVHICPSAANCLPHVQDQRTVIAQVGRAVFGNTSPLFYLLQLVTALILVLAANTAFNGFPVLASILARDGFLPRQLRNRGDRLAYSNGILLLSGFAILLIVVFQASPTRLIQLYIIGVFVSFTCSQTGMIRHWNRLLPGVTDRGTRRRMRRSRVINTVGACFTGVVLVIVLVSKFAEGAWIVVVAMPVIWLTMRGINRHYASVAAELVPPQDAPVTLPASNHAIVLVSKLHLPTLRALAYARATRPSRLEALIVDVDEAETQRLKDEWDRADIPVPLRVVASPYREITRPVVQYVKHLRRESPRDIVTVFIPEYVLGHWWEQVLHNQSALRLKARLLQQRGVVVASVPYQLKSAVEKAPGGLIAKHGELPEAAPLGPAKPSGPPAAERPDGRREAKTRTTPLQRLTAGREDLHAEELQAEIVEISNKPIGECGDREMVDVAGTLRTVTLRPRGPSLTMEADLWDGTGNITLVWLGRRDIKGIRPGRRIVVRGRVARIKGDRTIYNPQYELQPSAGDASAAEAAIADLPSPG